jgi:hypothetical protein
MQGHSFFNQRGLNCAMNVSRLVFPNGYGPIGAIKRYGISRCGKESLQLPKQPYRLNSPLAIYDLHADGAIIALKRTGASDAFGYHHRYGQHPMIAPVANIRDPRVWSSQNHVSACARPRTPHEKL